MSILALLLLAQAAAPLPGPKPDCFVRETSGGVLALRYIGDRACVDFDPAKTMTGVWINGFEGSSFHEGASGLADIKGQPLDVWLTLDEASVTPAGFPKGWTMPPHAYRLTFVGKRAKDMQRPPLSGYGHFGGSPGLVLVDTVTAWQDLGPVR